MDEDDNVPWHCIQCVIKQYADIFPFGLLTKNELLELLEIDIPSFLENIPTFSLKSKLSNIPNLADVDIENNLINPINSDYYELDAFKHKTKNMEKSFGLFLINISSLNLHFDELHTALNLLDYLFEVIGVTETKLSENLKYKTNISLKGYTFHYQPTKSFCGGLAIYVKNSLNHFPRSDLSVCEKEFEIIWVEIKRNHGKDILCCCSYRHPNTDKEKFIQYLDLVASKVAKEKKLIYLMGDFNFDLLQYDTDNNSYDFLNSIVENSMLPFIHQPTRIIDSSATLIDNIFSNNIEFESISGNLFINLSDHLPQFLIIHRTEDRHKQANFYKHDYQKFDKESFQDDFSLQNWANLEKADLDASQKFDDFLWRVNSCVIDMHH